MSTKPDQNKKKNMLGENVKRSIANNTSKKRNE